MDIRVVLDKVSVNKQIKTGWGFSVLVGNRVLFDTGEKGEWLLHNMREMGIDAEKDIESVVISHDHWDHTGGLQALLAARGKGTPVYICPGFSDWTKEKLVIHGGKPIEAEGFMEISENIYATGVIKGLYKGTPMPEQALVVKTGKGVSLLTGCAHPGILRMLKVVGEHFRSDRISLVMGGFHLLEEDIRIINFIAREFKKMGVERVGPTHCSGWEAGEIFAKEYGEGFISVKAGDTIVL